MKQVHLNRWVKKKKERDLVTQTRQAKTSLPSPSPLPHCQGPPSRSLQPHHNNALKQRSVRSAPSTPLTFHPTHITATWPPLLYHPFSTSPLALHHYELRHERFRLTFNPVCVFYCNMIHFSDFIRFLLENVNDWTRCQLSKTLWPCKGRFVIQVFILFCT